MIEKASGTDAQPGSDRRRSGGLGAAHQRAKEADVPKGNPSSDPEMSFPGYCLRKSKQPKRHMRKNGIMISIHIDQRYAL